MACTPDKEVAALLPEETGVETSGELLGFDEDTGAPNPNMLFPEFATAGMLPKGPLETLPKPASCLVLTSETAPVVPDTADGVVDSVADEPNLKTGPDGKTDAPEEGRLLVIKLGAESPLVVILLESGDSEVDRTELLETPPLAPLLGTRDAVGDKEEVDASDPLAEVTKENMLADGVDVDPDTGDDSAVSVVENNPDFMLLSLSAFSNPDDFATGSGETALADLWVKKRNIKVVYSFSHFTYAQR